MNLYKAYKTVRHYIVYLTHTNSKVICFDDPKSSHGDLDYSFYIFLQINLLYQYLKSFIRLKINKSNTEISLTETYKSIK